MRLRVFALIPRFLVLALLLGVGLQARAASTTNSARINDWQDFGCHQTPGGAGAPPSATSGAGGNSVGCLTCGTGEGMPVWSVDEPYINLWVRDEPLSYYTSSGQRIAFRWTYETRGQAQSPWSWRELDFLGARTPAFEYAADGLVPLVYSAQVIVGTNNCMTNASWQHNFWSAIIFWDHTLETNASNTHATTQLQSGTATNAYYGLTSFYEGALFRGDGGADYFNASNSNNATAGGQVKVGVLNLASSGGPKIPYFWQDQTTGLPDYFYPQSGTFYVSNAQYGFQVTYPDGSQDIYGLTLIVADLTTYSGFYIGTPTVPRDSTAVACLTKRIDPQGRATLVGYQAIINTNSNNSLQSYRVSSIMDSDGRVSTYGYATNNWRQLVSITDPYGRTAQFTPDDHCGLAAITDAQSNSTSFSYANYTNGLMTSMTTPYGTTSFTHYEQKDPAATNQWEQRAIVVSGPDSAYQLFCFLQSNSLPATISLVPSGTGSTFDTGSAGSFSPGLNFRDSFHWDERQFAALSATVLSELSTNLGGALGALATNDLQKARMKHWLLGGDSISLTELISSEADPSPDAAGTIPGQRTWYDYAGKSGELEMMGSSSLISCAAILLPNGSSRYARWTYANGFPSVRLDTYSLTNGYSGLLTNWFIYASNGIDLVTNLNSLGQFVSLAYNNSHQVTNLSDTLGHTNAFTWDTNTFNLTKMTGPGGATAALSYYGAGTSSNSSMLSQVVFQPRNLTESVVAYSNSLPRIVHTSGTGISDLWLTNAWDGLNRLTGTTFTDGTSISNIYTILDLTGHKDRLGNWTLYQYDPLEHLITITNAVQKVTRFGWCGCGGLTSITNALLKVTSLGYDNQGNVTSVAFPDGSGVTREFDLAGQLTAVLDGSGSVLSLAYNVQGLVTNVSNTNGTLGAVIYDLVSRPSIITDANGITVTNTYDLANQLITRTWPDGISEKFGWAANGIGLSSYANRDNQTNFYGRDPAGRVVASTNANLETNGFSYNAYDQVVGLTNGLGKITGWSYNQYGWLTNKSDNSGNPVFTNYYNANGWLATSWTPAGGTAVYHQDAVGNLTNIDYSGALLTTPSVSYAYDAVNELTNMIDGIGTSGFSFTQIGQLASEVGPWPTNGLHYGYTQGHRTSMSITSMVSTLNFAYGYDMGWRMRSVTSSAGVFGYSYPASASALVTGVALPNGASIANSYDSLARLTGTALLNHWGHVLDGYTYTPDYLGLRTSVQRNLGITTNTVNIGYDNIGQLASWTAVEGTSGANRLNEQLGFGYDAADNLHLRTNGAMVQTFTVDNFNQLSTVVRAGAMTFTGATPAPATNVTVNGSPVTTNGDFTFATTSGLPLSDGNNSFTVVAQGVAGGSTNTLTVNLPVTTSFTYDANRNMTFNGLRYSVWDAANRLTNVYVTNLWKEEFAYDGFGRRRIVKQYTWTNSAWSKTNEVHFMYDGLQIVQEINANVPQATYTRGLDLSGSLGGAGGIGGLLARTDATNGSTFYHADGVGNITALMDGYEDIVARYLYDPFGKPLGQWGRMGPVNTMGFSSMPWDPISGLVHYAEREFDVMPRRWLSPDPLGEAGGINLYQFAGNSPINFVDPYGLALTDYIPNWIGNLFPYSGPTYMAPNGTVSNGPPQTKNDTSNVGMLREDLGNDTFNTSQLQAVGNVMHAAADLNPIVGTFDSGYGAIQGRDAITYQELSDADRTQDGGVAAAGILPVVGVLSKCAKAVKDAKYIEDFATKATKNWSAMFKSEGEARAFARTKLGADPIEVSPGKWRSQDGDWQYRAKPGDVSDNHIHLEQLNTKTGEVIQNVHLRWPEGAGR